MSDNLDDVRDFAVSSGADRGGDLLQMLGDNAAKWAGRFLCYRQTQRARSR